MRRIDLERAPQRVRRAVALGIEIEGGLHEITSLIERGTGREAQRRQPVDRVRSGARSPLERLRLDVEREHACLLVRVAEASVHSVERAE